MPVIYKNNEKMKNLFEGNGNHRSTVKNVNNQNNFKPCTKKASVKESISNIDNNLPNTVTLLKTPDGGKCYVVGTAHFSVESQNEVARIIQAVQPHIVTVELCRDRIDILKLDKEEILKEATNFNFYDILQIIKENGINKGLIFLLSFKLVANLTKILGLPPGGEFRRALVEAKKIANCYLHMGDRPIKITFSRALAYLSLWQKIKLTWQFLTQNITAVTQEDVEKYKNRDLVEELVSKLADEYPVLEEIFIKERDIYLTHSLQLACKPKISPFGEVIPARVVGVVGIGHMLGIINNWGKVHQDQIPPIMSIPPPSSSNKILFFTTKASISGIIIYSVYRLYLLYY